MNNSFLAQENISLELQEEVDITPKLRERESDLLAIIDALKIIGASNEWSTLKKKVFDGLVNTLNKQIHEEAIKENPDTLTQNRLAGQLKWAEKYSDLKKLEDFFKIELSRIRKQLHGKERQGRKSRDGARIGS